MFLSRDSDISFNFRKCWLIAWLLLVSGSTIALIHVSKDTCGEHIPILLSRALTTDPYRGVCLVFCLFAAISSIYLNSVLLTIGFVSFYSAFLVSMFDTATSHDALILIGAMLVMFECRPGKNIYWKTHWWATVAAGNICAAWFLYIIYMCEAPEYDGGLPLPDAVYCARCSWWFISEYVCFWSMFMLVYWRIDPNLTWHDRIRPVSVATGTEKKNPSKKYIKDGPAIHF